jgi:hypothetical protein
MAYCVIACKRQCHHAFGVAALMIDDALLHTPVLPGTRALLRSGLECLTRYTSIPTPLLHVVCYVGKSVGSFSSGRSTPDPIGVTLVVITSHKFNFQYLVITTQQLSHEVNSRINVLRP